MIRVANCNLHNQAVGEGISAVVQEVNVRQYIEQQQQQQQQAEASRLQAAGQAPAQPLALAQPPLLRRSVWLEAGSVNMNLITADIALAADHPAKCEVQRHFLELHDAQTKRYLGQAKICVSFVCFTHLTWCPGRFCLRLRIEMKSYKTLTIRRVPVQMCSQALGSC